MPTGGSTSLSATTTLLSSLFCSVTVGRLPTCARLTVRCRRRAGRLVLADLNGDRRLDLASGTAADTIVVLLGNGRGGFTPAPGSPLAAGPGPWAVEVADVNGDAKLDILTANFEDGTVTVLLAR
jgi:hypothetical protein